MASPWRSSTALFRLSYSATLLTPPKAAKASTWPRRKLSMRASSKKRRKIMREWLSTITKAINGRRARPICRWPK